jgi:uncharacterized membrane protein
MIQRLIGVSIGAIVTFIILWFSTVVGPADPIGWYLAAAILGAVASFFWPVILGLRARGRARDRREAAIQREVERQISDRQGG